MQGFRRMSSPIGLNAPVFRSTTCSTWAESKARQACPPAPIREPDYDREAEMNRTGIVGELWMFMRERKKWWLLPVIALLLFVGSLIVVAQGSALAPFIYTIF